MDKSAVRQADQNLGRANSALEAMKVAKRDDELQISWSDLLGAVHRVFSKLEQGAKVKPASRTWFIGKKNERRSDPLLSYIHHARNVDEHGLTPSAQPGPGFKLGPPQYERVATLGRPGQPTRVDTVQLRAIEIDSHNARLFPVVDRGVTYNPPTEHLGTPIPKVSPIAVAELAVSYLRDMIEEARKHI